MLENVLFMKFLIPPQNFTLEIIRMVFGNVGAAFQSEVKLLIGEEGKFSFPILHGVSHAALVNPFSEGTTE